MLYELEDSIKPWGWQTVILAAAVLREHETMSDEDYNSIIALVGPDTHEGVPDYAAKAFSTAVTYLVQRQGEYEEMLRKSKEEAQIGARLREMLETPKGRANLREMLGTHQGRADVREMISEIASEIKAHQSQLGG